MEIIEGRRYICTKPRYALNIHSGILDGQYQGTMGEIIDNIFPHIEEEYALGQITPKITKVLESVVYFEEDEDFKYIGIRKETFCSHFELLQEESDNVK